MSYEIHSLGKLEKLVMEALWDRGDGTVREVRAQPELKKRAYTTVMTTLDRLHGKGFLNRQRDGNAYRYRPVLTREAFWQHEAEDLIKKMVRAGGESALTAFVDAAATENRENLDQLAELVEQRLHRREES